MATFRTFIPVPASPPVTIETDPPDLGRKYRFIVNMTPDWYLFFSRKLSSTTPLLDGTDFGVDQNILSTKAFHARAPIQPQQDNGVLIYQIFGG